MARTSEGVRLALLLLGAFDAMVDEVVAELDRGGHPGVTANLEFALGAIGGGADSAAALGRSLRISRQAAAKTVAALEDLGYVARVDDPADARRKRLRVTPRGEEMTALGAAVFDRLRAQWVSALEPGRADLIEDALVLLAGSDPTRRAGPAPTASPGGSAAAG